MKYDKYLTEKVSSMKEIIANLDGRYFKQLDESYWGVSDHIDNLVSVLDDISKENPEFKSEYMNAKKAFMAFKKLSLGQYL